MSTYAVHFYMVQMNNGSRHGKPSKSEVIVARSVAIMTDIAKAYMMAAPKFHECYKQIFDISLRTTLRMKDKYVQSLYRESDLNCFIDEAIRYRIGLSQKEPNRNNFIYSMNDPYMLTESLDDILYKIMYSACPEEALMELRQYLEGYNLDERVIDVVMSKLEVNIQPNNRKTI